MRVVHIITRLIIGGAQENTLYNVEDLVELFGDEVTLVTGPAEGPEGDLFRRAHAKRLDVRLVPDLRRAVHPLADWRAYRKLVALICELRPQVVHTHSSKAGILGRAAAHRCRVPAIVHTIHGLPFHPFERWWRNALYVAAERWAAKRCDRIITVADAMIDQAVAAGVAERDRFVTIYSGMEVEPFLTPTRQPSEVRRQLGLANGELVVGKVARLFELKGHDDVIDAARSLVGEFPNLRFLFVGGGIWQERLEARIQALGLSRHFVFVGLVPPERVAELLAACDLVVHASYREGLARVLPQALLGQKPVVSYDVDGAREVVLPERTGVLVPVGDVAGLSQGLRVLLADPALRHRFGVAGRALCLERFRHDVMSRKIRQVYEEILAQKGRT
jgi:glycosyltransferase involved in cell wall biosynthesis